jgi:CO/xanthine dehydrogenase Mo-binding subunit
MNFMHDGDASPLGEVIPHVKASETLSRALDAAGFTGAKEKNIGRGCAIADWVSKGGESYAIIKIDEHGNVTLSSAVTDTGPGVFTMMRQIVGEELSVPLDAIAVEMLDSNKVVKDTGVRAAAAARTALDARCPSKMRDSQDRCQMTPARTNCRLRWW